MMETLIPKIGWFLIGMAWTFIGMVMWEWISGKELE